MPFNHWSDNLEEIHSFLIEELMDSPDCESAPRGKPIKELIAPTITLTDPRNRLIRSPARNVNYGFAVGELCWYVRGDTDLATMRYYNKRMSQFSDDGETINSAYGARIFNSQWVDWSSDRSQFDNVIDELKRDPDSRRAVMHINEPLDLRRAVERESKDVPCTMSLQLLIRNRRLHMFVVMRSNDVIWGFPYDVFSFTCLQEAFLYTLQEAGVPVDDLGDYHHTAGSLHIYDTHYQMAGEVRGESMPKPSPMKPFTLAGLDDLAHEFEPDIRFGPSVDYSWPHENDTITWMIEQLMRHRAKRKAEQAKALDELVEMTEEMGGYPELMQEEEKK